MVWRRDSVVFVLFTIFFPRFSLLRCGGSEAKKNLHQLASRPNGLRVNQRKLRTEVTHQICRFSQRVPAEEVGVTEAEDAVRKGELDAEVGNEAVQLPQLDRPLGVSGTS